MSSFRRCIHGVRMPEWVSGETNPYCSGCETPKEPLAKKQSEFTPFPYGEKKCPVCEEITRFKFIDEWRWHCIACGADALDVNG